MGFKGAILHGLCTWNIAAHAVVKEIAGGEGERLRFFMARFASPVLPGDKLVVEMWRTGVVEEGAEEVLFRARVEGGKVVLSNGRALVAVKAGSRL